MTPRVCNYALYVSNSSKTQTNKLTERHVRIVWYCLFVCVLDGVCHYNSSLEENKLSARKPCMTLHYHSHQFILPHFKIKLQTYIMQWQATRKTVVQLAGGL